MPDRDFKGDGNNPQVMGNQPPNAPADQKISPFLNTGLTFLNGAARDAVDSAGTNLTALSSLFDDVEAIQRTSPTPSSTPSSTNSTPS